MSCAGSWCPRCECPDDAEHCDACRVFAEYPEGTWVRVVQTKDGPALYTPISRWRNFVLWLRFAKDRYRWTR